jgi:hypothetical protein
MRLLPALLTTAVWFWAPAAFAAPPWTAPGDPVSGEHVSIERPRVFFADDGAAVATYSFAGDRGSAGGHGIAVRTPGAGEFAEPRTFTRAETLVGVLPFGRTHLVAATEDRGTLSAALGRTNGTFGRWQRVRTSRQMLRPSLAGDVRGDLALVWFENRGTRNDRVFVSLRRPGGRFGTPVLVATDRVRQTAVAVSSRGSVLVAWETAGRIRVRVRASDAKRFGRIQTLASRPTFGAIPRAAFAPNGRAYVAWAGQSPGEGASSGPVEVAIKPPTSSRFRAAQTLDESGHHPSALSMAVANDNGALVAWSDDGRSISATGSTRRWRSGSAGAPWWPGSAATRNSSSACWPPTAHRERASDRPSRSATLVPPASRPPRSGRTGPWSS